MLALATAFLAAMGCLGVLPVALTGFLRLGLDLVYSSFGFGHGSEMNGLNSLS